MTDPAGGRVTYAVRGWLAGALAAGALVAAGIAATTPAPGRLLFVVAACGAAVEAARAVLQRPTLVADERGIDVAVGLRRQRHPWSAVEAVRTLQPRGSRPRRRANALEIDLGARLLVVPGYRLGAPPGDVADTLDALRGGAGGF